MAQNRDMARMEEGAKMQVDCWIPSSFFYSLSPRQIDAASVELKRVKAEMKVSCFCPEHRLPMLVCRTGSSLPRRLRTD